MNTNVGGFSFATFLNRKGEHKTDGIQMGFANDYGVNILSHTLSTDERFTYNTVSVLVMKELSNGLLENRTIEIMAKMYHTPLECEIKGSEAVFMYVTPEKLVKILSVVSNMQIQ